MANGSIRCIEVSASIPKRFVDLAASGHRSVISEPIEAARSENKLSIS
jgi:hypothetical protein